MSYPPSTYGPPAGLTAQVYETIERHGDAGCSMSQLVEATGQPELRLLGLLHNLRGRQGRRVLVYSLPVYGRITRYFLATVPREHAEDVVQREGERLRIAGREASRRAELERKARHREKVRAMKAEAKAAAAAERVRLRELVEAAAAVRRIDARQEAGQRTRSMAPLKRGEHALSNALAKKIKADGTRGAAPAEKPAPTITWPENIAVHRAPRTPGRWEPQSVQPMFSALPLGQYLETAP